MYYPVVLYGCESWSLNLREEHVKSFRGEWRKLYNSELHALYSSPNINRNLKSTGDWTDLAQDSVQWLTYLRTVTILRVP